MLSWQNCGILFFLDVEGTCQKNLLFHLVISFVVEFCFDPVWSTEMFLMIEHEPYHGTIPTHFTLHIWREKSWLLHNFCDVFSLGKCGFLYGHTFVLINFIFKDKIAKNGTPNVNIWVNSFESNFGFGRLPWRRLGCGWSPNSEEFSNLGNNINIYRSLLDFAINLSLRRFWG